jgi:hypothetical protein
MHSIHPLQLPGLGSFFKYVVPLLKPGFQFAAVGDIKRFMCNRKKLPEWEGLQHDDHTSGWDPRSIFP